MLESIHRDPHYYSEPETFKPERWLASDVEMVPSSYIPFGEGLRKCVGERVALVQMKAFLFTIMKDWKMMGELAPMRPDADGWARRYKGHLDVRFVPRR